MISVKQSPVFAAWLAALKDAKGKAAIQARIERLSHGNAGDCEPVGSGVSEMRIHVGPGYRVYFMKAGDRIYLLLSGGDKSSQRRDIKAALLYADIIKGR